MTWSFHKYLSHLGNIYEQIIQKNKKKRDKKNGISAAELLVKIRITYCNLTLI